jgi:hypothetical protein
MQEELHRRHFDGSRQEVVAVPNLMTKTRADTDQNPVSRFRTPEPVEELIW